MAITQTALDKMVTALKKEAAQFKEIAGLPAITVGAVSQTHDKNVQAFNIYAAAYSNGARPQDIIPINKKGSTATVEGLAAYKLMGMRKAWSPTEAAFMVLPAPKKDDLSPEANEARDERKSLSGTRDSVIRTFQRGLKTQDKIHRPELYKKGAGGRKLPIDLLQDHFDHIVKICQGEGLPESMDVPTLLAHVQAVVKTHKIPTKIINLDDILETSQGRQSSLPYQQKWKRNNAKFYRR